MTLSTELQRIADGAPPIPVDPDTWARARAARRRDRRRVGAAALVAAVVVVGVTLLPRGATEPEPAAAGLRVEAVTGPGSTDLAVGVARAAYVARDGAAVVVGVDEVAHPLDLPGRSGPVALSPDGTRLAFGRVDDDRVVMQVLDLRTGAETSAGLRRQQTIEQLRWDQAGWSLVFAGRDVDGAPKAGLLLDGADISIGLDARPDALLGLTTNRVAVALQGRDVSTLRRGRGAPLDVLESGNRDPVLGGCTRGFQLTFLSRSDAGELTAWTYDVRLSRVDEGRRAVPAAALGDLGAVTEVVGCVPGDDPLLADRLLLRTDGAGPGDPDELVVLTLGDTPSSVVVGEVEHDVPALTVATDLVD